LRFIQAGLHEWWAGSKLEEATINGRLGLIQHEGGAVAAAVTFAWNEDGRLTDVFIMRNPDKLARIETAPRIE
jgi:RNA polymerase sigma-70 factor (ECF subfamily)